MDVTRLRLSDLKKELGRRGLDTAGGLKAELAERLQAALDEGGGGGGPEKMVGWERLPAAGKNGIHDNTDQGNMQGCQSFEHCNVKKEEECEYEQVVLDPELPGLQSDGIHDNTHQGNMQGCQSFEYCSVKNEDECEYERVILDPELPGLHSEMKSEFKQEEPDSDYNMTASSFNAPSSGYSGASPYDSSVSCHSVPFFGHGISDSPHSLRQQQGRKRPVEGSRSRGYYEHRDSNSDCGVMIPKKAVEAGKRKREMILLEVKKEIIRKHEGGMRLRDLAKEYGKGSSTISGILMMKEKIKGRDAAKGSTVVSKLRPPVLEEVEKLLLLWIEEKQRAGDKVTEAIICGKAKALHADLLNQQPGTSTDSKDFKATRGWYDRFKNRSGIHSVVKHGDAVSADVAEAFATKFLETVVSQGYLPQQVFNCDETLLFWKRMPRGAFITLPGHMKDHLTLLFCANASGDLKVKPLLVYHSESPRAFKKHKVKTEQLSVLWRSNPKAWVTRHLFVEWVNLVFGPLVKQYLLGNNLPLKAVLLMDNAPAHPPGLEKELLEDFNFIKVMFLPPSTTPLLQPMGQQVISSFKKLYTKELFRRCYEMTDRSGLTLCEFWKYHFDIVSCLQIITIAWAGVSQRNLNSAWGNLWPDSVVAPDADAPSPESTVLEEIVSLGRTMGLEVTEEDVYELVEGHNRELTTEDLVELQKDMGEEQISFEEEEVSEEHLSSRELKKACKMWVNLQTFVQQHHPYKALAKRLMNSVDTIIMSTFRGMLKRRHRQQTMDKFLQKKPRHEEEPACARAAPFPSSSKKC